MTQEQINQALTNSNAAGLWPLPGVVYPVVPLRPRRRHNEPKFAVVAVWLFAVAGLLALRYWPSNGPSTATTACNSKVDSNCRR